MTVSSVVIRECKVYGDVRDFLKIVIYMIIIYF